MFEHGSDIMKWYLGINEKENKLEAGHCLH